MDQLEDAVAPPWDDVLALCLRAGEEIRAHYETPEGPERLAQKADDSPLTRADIASHRILAAGLAALTPHRPVLSEESDPAAIAGRRSWSSFWMVDPLDGTREFLERSGEFTINIALIEAQRAVAGVIYLPLERRACLGVVGRGAWEIRCDDGARAARSISTRKLPEDELVLLASRRHRNARLERTIAFLAAERPLRRDNAGSALKFCQLAAGEGDVYPRFSPCSEWDVAAGDAIVTAAGGAVLGMDGRALRYNARESLLAEPFLGVGDPGLPLWSQLLSTVAGADGA